MLGSTGLGMPSKGVKSPVALVRDIMIVRVVSNLILKIAAELEI